MPKRYYCKMDKSVFSTEEELLKHIRSKYVQVFEGKDHEVSDLLYSLQNDFPDYEINIEDGSGWFAQYKITLTKNKGIITEYYGSVDNKSPYNLNKPMQYNQLVESVKEKINTYEAILKEVKEKYNFHTFDFKSFSYGYSEDEHSFNFSYKVNENDPLNIEEFYPYDIELEEYVGRLNKYFVKALEGKPSNFYDDGYFVDYTIDGIEIGMLMANKKVRLEVVE